MLNVFNMEDIITNDMTQKDEERIYNLQTNPNSLFKSNENNYILFHEEDKHKIEKYFGLKIYHDMPITEYIGCFDGGEFLNITNDWQIDISKCIDIFIKNIDKYEDRLFNSNNFVNEIEMIIKEQAIKVFADHVKEIIEAINVINNGKFEWE